MNSHIKMMLKGAIVAAGMSVAGTAVAQDEVTLRWGHYLPNSPFLEVEQNFVKNIAERTGGKVKIEITYAGGLGKGNEVMTLAGRGAIDMASVVPGYYADQLLFIRAFQIPFVFDNPAEAMTLSRNSFAELPMFDAELEKFNINFLFHQPLGVYYLTGPDEGCTDIANLEGKKIRSFGADIPKLHAAVGAVPVSVGVGDVYEALQRGTLDYSFLNPGNIVTNRLYEVGKYSCGPVMAITGHLIVIGDKAWDKLTPETQAIFTEEAAKSQAEYLAWIDAFESGAVEGIKAGGGVIKDFPADQLASWKEKAPDLLANWVEDMKGRGMGDEAVMVQTKWKEWLGR
ncbi:MAG: TRAP transporter substrate-binding protein DctP [Alphaproteobacteria bacterium]|jgi:TRAP-type C4-dicarboxylate transport system substrate-binding protein|nr:TRAP transporter substrate-binding protein DctP [Alphaproteobacteria bacterium]